MLPTGSCEEAIAVFMLLEHGHWSYEMPFFSLPPDKGERIRQLLERNISHGLAKQFEILAELKRIGAGGSTD